MTSLPILNYHGIESRPGEYDWQVEELPYVISKQAFEAQMNDLKSRGISPSSKTLMLTFDDGLMSHYEHAAPVLKAKHFHAIFFVSAGLVGQKGKMGWHELKELLRGGFEIGSHGLSHIPLTPLSDRELLKELKVSKKILEENLGAEVRSFSVPRGFYGPRVRAVAAESGYRFVFTSEFHVNEGKRDPLALGRLAVTRDVSMKEFSERVEGRLGVAGYWEPLKGLARRVIAPPIYDGLARLKRGVLLR